MPRQHRLRLPDEVWQGLEPIARARGLSVNALVTQIAREFLHRPEGLALAIEDLITLQMDTEILSHAHEVLTEHLAEVLGINAEAENFAQEVRAERKRRGLGGMLSTFLSIGALAFCPVNMAVGCHGSAQPFNVREPKVKLARKQNWDGPRR